MSSGPLVKPLIAMARTGRSKPSEGRSSRRDNPNTTMGHTSRPRSRPMVFSRPEKKAAPIPNTPLTANKRPTTASPWCSRLSTISGRRMLTAPPARLSVETEMPRPLRVG